MPNWSEDDHKQVAKADRRRFFAAVFAHGGARFLSKLASAPLDRIKVCLQVSALRSTPGQVLSSGSVCLTLRPHTFAGKIPASVNAIVESQGIRSLWRGAGVHISGISLGAVARLGVLKHSQMWTMPFGSQQYDGIEAYARRCAFLYVSGVAALSVAYPLDVAYTCLTADMGRVQKYTGLVHFMKATRHEHGILSLYRGFPLAIGTALPFIAIATAAHDVLARSLLQRMGQPPPVNDRTVPPGGELFWLSRSGAPAHLFPYNLLVGAASGFIAQSVTYPLDTLRRTWQHTCTAPLASRPKSIRDLAVQMHARGWRTFYAGYGVNTVKLVPELLVLCGVYLQINASGSFV